jgi:TRAP-type C4-dicarboxylate transport system permease small subunit
VPAIVFLQVPFAIVSGTMLRTTLIYEFCSKNGKKIINVLSFAIGIMLFIGISVGGWTDMIKGWEIREYQGIGAIEFPVYIVRSVIIFASIMIVFIYSILIFNEFKNKND